MTRYRAGQLVALSGRGLANGSAGELMMARVFILACLAGSARGEKRADVEKVTRERLVARSSGWARGQTIRTMTNEQQQQLAENRTLASRVSSQPDTQ